jgi:hypothetical protein
MMEERMPDERWRRGLAIGVGTILALAFLAVTAVAAGLTWTNPETISMNNPLGSPAEKVDAVDIALAEEDGSLQAVWVEKVTGATTTFNIYHASATSAGEEWTWSAPDTVLNDQYSPASLAVDGSTRLHVTYPNKNKSSIRFSRGTWSGSSWTWQPAVLNSPPNFGTTQADTAGFPVIAVSGSNLHVVWIEIGDDPPYNQHFQIVHGASQDWGDTWPQALTTEVYSSTKMSQYPDMVVGQDGKLHVVWEEGASDAVIYYTYGTTSGANVSWSTPITVSGTMTDCHRPSVAVVGDQLYVAWGQRVGAKTNQDVYYSTKTVAEGTWPTPTKLPNGHVGLGNTAPTYVSPRIAATSEGRVIIAWDGYVSAEQNGKEDIYFSEATNIADSGAWTERSNVSSNAGASYGPTIVLDDSGIVHVMWIDEFNVLYAHSQYQVFLPLTLKNQ